MEYNFTDASKVFFTSDTHFGHQNILRFCNRPWATIAEHDQALIQNWNDTVPEDAVVFHLGDFCYKGGGFPTIQHLIGLLHGQIILIRGNHDPDTRKLQNLRKLQQLFDGVFDQLQIEVDGQRILMNHYPLLTWPHAYGQHPTWQLFGHVHLRKGITGSDAFIVEQCCRSTQYEVGVDLNGYRPISFHRLQERIDFQIKNKCIVLNWLNYE